jgi:hypothetical protein
MIARVNRRQRTDRQGGMIDRVRDYLSRSDPGREQAAVRRRPGALNWEDVVNVHDYVYVLEVVVAGDSVSAYRLNECRSNYRDSIVELGLQPHPRAKTYADAASVYVLTLERAAQAEEHHGRPRDELQREYQDAYAAIFRDSV